MLPFYYYFLINMLPSQVVFGVLTIICTMQVTDSHAYDFFADNNQEQFIDDQYNPENADLNQIQKHLAEQHDQEENNYEILKNSFYSNERINIYNYTAYNADTLKNKMMNGASDHVGLNDLFISFGYGVSYKINADHKIGYEYISSFPYDRGQLIRIFWIWSF